MSSGVLCSGLSIRDRSLGLLCTGLGGRHGRRSNRTVSRGLRDPRHAPGSGTARCSTGCRPRHDGSAQKTVLASGRRRAAWHLKRREVDGNTLSLLLQQGIGDTIRISLTPEPGGDRSKEVVVAQEILQSLGLRSFAPMVVACPGCGRTSSTFFQELADRIQRYLREQMPVWSTQYPGVENMNVAVMGCIVNGPGESKHADIGISLPGADESPVAPVYIDGERTVTLKGDHIAEEFQAIVENYVERRYGAKAAALAGG